MMIDGNGNARGNAGHLDAEAKAIVIEGITGGKSNADINGALLMAGFKTLSIQALSYRRNKPEMRAAVERAVTAASQIGLANRARQIAAGGNMLDKTEKKILQAIEEAASEPEGLNKVLDLIRKFVDTAQRLRTLSEVPGAAAARVAIAAQEEDLQEAPAAVESPEQTRLKLLRLAGDIMEAQLKEKGIRPVQVALPSPPEGYETS